MLFKIFIKPAPALALALALASVVKHIPRLVRQHDPVA
jgi:hypothetical protein